MSNVSSSSSASYSISEPFEPKKEEKKSIPEKIEINSQECLKHLRLMKERTQYKKEQVKNIVALSSCLYKKLEYKQELIFIKDEEDFINRTISKIEKSDNHCHSLYENFQRYLDTKPKMQGMSLYDYMAEPERLPTFTRSQLPRHKKGLRYLEGQTLNIRTGGINGRIYKDLI